MTITTACPYCGTTYFEARSNCENCGAALPPPTPLRPGPSSIFTRSVPPMPPRPVPRNFISNRLLVDGGGLVGFIFTILGVIFTPVGLLLALFSSETVMALVFGLIGAVFLFIGPLLLARRVNALKTQQAILRDGQASIGCIADLRRDTSIEINGRSPWVLSYSFTVMGKPFQGKALTLRELDPDLRRGSEIYVLYDPDDPQSSTLYLDL